MDLAGVQLSELLAAEPLNFLASVELVLRVMCRPRPREDQLRMNLEADLVCLSHCLSLVARHEGGRLLADAVGRGKDSGRLLRRLTSLLVTGQKAALAVMHSGTGRKPDTFRELTAATGEEGLCWGRVKRGRQCCCSGTLHFFLQILRVWYVWLPP